MYTSCNGTLPESSGSVGWQPFHPCECTASGGGARTHLGTRAESGRFPPSTLQSQYSPGPVGEGKLGASTVARYLPPSKTCARPCRPADATSRVCPSSPCRMLPMLVVGAPRRAARERVRCGQLCDERQPPGDPEARSLCRELRPLARATERQCIDTGSEHSGIRAGSTHARHWVPRGT